MMTVVVAELYYMMAAALYYKTAAVALYCRKMNAENS